VTDTIIELELISNEELGTNNECFNPQVDVSPK